MLYTIMRYIRNFFSTRIRNVGVYKIQDGTISLPFLSEGMYFLLEGSVHNDGVYRYPATGLTDEEFEGDITLLAPPKAFLELVSEIESYTNSNTIGGLQSESFGGYSYSRATNGSGGLADWQDVYKERLNVWRKL